MSKPVPPVQKYMTTSPVTTEASATVAAAAKVMKANSIRHLPVVDGGSVVGLISDRDIALVEGLVGVDPEIVTVRDAMATEPYTTRSDTPITEVAATMASNKYGSAVVTQNGKVVGMFTTVDVCRVLAEVFETRIR
ncbi:MAG: CBS domain-containing protein [Deltaproteobacteria bacterium]|nr:CBS domain-containing protein [Deltaproteobacteria bacterium]